MKCNSYTLDGSTAILENNLGLFSKAVPLLRIYLGEINRHMYVLGYMYKNIQNCTVHNNHTHTTSKTKWKQPKTSAVSGYINCGILTQQNTTIEVIYSSTQKCVKATKKARWNCPSPITEMLVSPFSRFLHGCSYCCDQVTQSLLNV